MAGNYNGGYWADRAFPAAYRRSFVEASRQMAKHFQAKKWHDTLFQGAGFAGEDAGVIHFGQLKPQDVWALRVRLGEVLSDAAPAPKRRLIELRTPPRHPENLAPAYVSVGEVPVRD
jgi:hypothetical protein